jgi:hypothetical protein
MGLAALLSLGGCASDPARPVIGEAAFVVNWQGSQVVVVDVANAAVVARAGPVPAFKGVSAFDARNGAIYVTGYDNTLPPNLVRVETATLRVTATRYDSINARSTVGPLELYGTYGMAALADSTGALVVDGRVGSVPGVVKLEGSTYRPVAFGGPFVVAADGLATLSPAQYPGGAVLVAAARDSMGSQVQDYLFVLDPVTLSPRDSFRFTAPRGGSFSAIGRFLVSTSGSDLYVVADNSILRFDLLSRQVTASAPRPTSGALCLSHDGSRLFVTDPGDMWDYPGAGIVRSFSAALGPLPSIDLNGPSPGISPELNRCALSADDSVLLVSSGTGSRGPLFGPQRARLYVVSLSSGAFSIVELGGWAARDVFVP